MTDVATDRNPEGAMTDTEQRVAFETWAKERGYKLHHDGEDYYSGPTSKAWKVWQAATAHAAPAPDTVTLPLVWREENGWHVLYAGKLMAARCRYSEARGNWYGQSSGCESVAPDAESAKAALEAAVRAMGAG